MKTIVLALAMSLLLPACSGGDEPAATGKGDHVWKEQVGTMDKAKDAEKAVMDAAARQSEAIQQQTE